MEDKPIPIKGKLSLWEYDGEVEVMDFGTDEEEEEFVEKYWDLIIDNYINLSYGLFSCT